MLQVQTFREQVTSSDSSLFPQDYFISFAFPFPSLWCSIPNNESCPVFLCHCFFWMPHLWIQIDVSHCWFLSDLILFFLIRILFPLCDCFVSWGDAQYNDFEVLFLFVRQCFNPPKFALNTFLLKIRPLIIIVFPFFFFTIFVSFSMINPCILVSLLKRGGFLSWISFQGFLSQTDC